jgi:hypothetical protein
MIERYYLQKMNQHQFLVCEVQGKEPDKEDRIVRTFVCPEDACGYVDAINIVQRYLNEKYGHWACKAV